MYGTFVKCRDSHGKFALQKQRLFSKFSRASAAGLASGSACGGRVTSGFIEVKPLTRRPPELGLPPKVASGSLMSKKIAI